MALVGAIGSQSQGFGTGSEVGKHVWSFGPGAIWPLLDFGALDAQVDIADLAAHASLMNYRKTILNAVQEVDTSVAAYDAERARLEKLDTAMEAGQRAVDWRPRATIAASLIFSMWSTPNASSTTCKNNMPPPRLRKASSSCVFTEVWVAAGRTIRQSRPSACRNRP